MHENLEQLDQIRSLCTVSIWAYTARRPAVNAEIIFFKTVGSERLQTKSDNTIGIFHSTIASWRNSDEVVTAKDALECLERDRLWFLAERALADIDSSVCSREIAERARTHQVADWKLCDRCHLWQDQSASRGIDRSARDQEPPHGCTAGETVSARIMIQTKSVLNGQEKSHMTDFKPTLIDSDGMRHDGSREYVRPAFRSNLWVYTTRACQSVQVLSQRDRCFDAFSIAGSETVFTDHEIEATLSKRSLKHSSKGAIWSSELHPEEATPLVGRCEAPSPSKYRGYRPSHRWPILFRENIWSRILLGEIDRTFAQSFRSPTAM